MIGLLLFLPLLLGLALIAGLVTAGRWFVAADPATLATRLRSAGGLAMVAVGALLVARGQVMLGLSLMLAGIGRMGLGRSPSLGGLGGPGGFAGTGGFAGAAPRGARARPSGGQSSTVRTSRLSATLDHDSGTMDGDVLSGRYAGCRLSQMSDGQVLNFWRECAGEADSRLLVEAYLDRRCPRWREDIERDGNAGPGEAGRARRSGPMTEEEAYEVLGLSPGAPEAQIRAAHRRLMKQMHPDQGGSTFLAAQLNEAKDVLLRRR